MSRSRKGVPRNRLNEITARRNREIQGSLYLCTVAIFEYCFLIALSAEGGHPGTLGRLFQLLTGSCEDEWWTQECLVRCSFIPVSSPSPMSYIACCREGNTMTAVFVVPSTSDDFKPVPSSSAYNIPRTAFRISFSIVQERNSVRDRPDCPPRLRHIGYVYVGGAALYVWPIRPPTL